MRARGPWKYNTWYSALRPYVDFCTRFSYRHARVEGLENIPAGAAVLIAPNHCNTLMDALVVLRARREATVFGARADIFENKTVARILRFLRILPMVRRRDGIRKVLRNYETIDQVVDVLTNGVPFCMFAEGMHRTKHSLLPINKGIFRIAKTAHEALAGAKDVVIVPAGLEYGDYFHYRSWSRLRFGKPVNVSAFMREHPEMSEPEIYNGLRSLLVPAISGQFVCLPDDESYDASWNEFEDKFSARTGSIPRLAGLPRTRGGRIALAVLLSPFFVLSAILTLPMWGIAELICKSKVKDPAFRNTVRFGAKLLGTVIMGIIWAVAAFIYLPWWAAVLVLVYFLVSYSLFYDWLNLVRE